MQVPTEEASTNVVRKTETLILAEGILLPLRSVRKKGLSVCKTEKPVTSSVKLRARAGQTKRTSRNDALCLSWLGCRTVRRCCVMPSDGQLLALCQQVRQVYYPVTTFQILPSR